MTSETLLPEIPLEATPPPHPAWSLLDVSVVALSVIFGMLLSAFLATLALILVKHGAKPDIKGLAANALFLIPVQLGSYLFAAMAAVTLVHGRSRIPFLRAIHWNRPAADVGYAATGFVAALLVLVAQRYIDMPKDLPIERYFHEPRSAWLMLGFGVFIAPFAEEVFFRGLLYPALGRTFSRRRDLAGLASVLLMVAAGRGIYVQLRWHALSHAAMWIAGAAVLLLIASATMREGMPWNRGFPQLLAVGSTAALFALVHQAQLAGAGAPLAILFCVGLLLTLIRRQADSVCASWLAHFFYNGTLFGVMLLATNGFRNLEELAR